MPPLFRPAVLQSHRADANTLGVTDGSLEKRRPVQYAQKFKHRRHGDFGGALDVDEVPCCIIDESDPGDRSDGWGV